MSIAYFDNSATTKVSEKAAQKALQMMTENFANPASLHAMGLEAEREMENARSAVAKKFSCEPSEVVFTSGGTEANNLALFGAAEAGRRTGKKIITTQIEHPSVFNAAKELERRGFEVVYLPICSDGKIRLSDLEKALDETVILVSIMQVNNETGAIQPIEEAARRVKEVCPDALFHSDIVQGFGKMPISVKQFPVDLLSVSGHKLHAPKGVGALYVRKGVRIVPTSFGGGQERKFRSGTPATPNIAAFGTALEELCDMPATFCRVASMKRNVQSVLTMFSGFAINSPPDGLPHILNFSVEGIPSEVMIHFLEQKNVFVSGGSACARGARSRALTAQGLSAGRVDSALRVSFSRNTTSQEIEMLIDGLIEGYTILRRQGKHR